MQDPVTYHEVHYAAKDDFWMDYSYGPLPVLSTKKTPFVVYASSIIVPVKSPVVTHGHGHDYRIWESTLIAY